jgi:peptide deformylase
MNTNLKILKYPDIKLKEISKRIPKVTNELMGFAGLMLATMVENGGIGLAAIQVGRAIELITIDTKQIDKLTGVTLVLFNPKILSHSTTTSKLVEGCLSLPGEEIEVDRPTTITVEYMDLMNNIIVREFTGLNSKVVQHEMDHLVGITLLEYKV